MSCEYDEKGYKRGEGDRFWDSAEVTKALNNGDLKKN